jgi:hypothetical protein
MPAGYPGYTYAEKVSSQACLGPSAAYKQNHAAELLMKNANVRENMATPARQTAIANPCFWGLTPYRKIATKTVQSSPANGVFGPPSDQCKTPDANNSPFGRTASQHYRKHHYKLSRNTV